MLDLSLPDIPCIIITDLEFDQTQAEAWNLPWPAPAGFWYVPEGTDLYTWCCLAQIGQQSRIPGFTAPYLRKYPYGGNTQPRTDSA